MDPLRSLPRQVNRSRRGFLLAFALVTIACGAAPATPPVPPSEAEALAYLRSVVAVVRAGDLDRLCDLGSGTCPQTLRNSDPATVPMSDPIVIGTRVLEPFLGPNGTWNEGGRVLELCGRDGLDHRYYSEMLVFGDRDHLISTVPVYWIGVRIASSSTTGQEPAPPPCPGS